MLAKKHKKNGYKLSKNLFLVLFSLALVEMIACKKSLKIRIDGSSTVYPIYNNASD